MNPDDNLKNFERHVVLISPEVHWNTGNIGRTCIGTGARLHLIRPLGFSLDSRQVKRAGLDYWKHVNLSVWENFDDFLLHLLPFKREICIFTKNGKKSFRQMRAGRRMFLIFGSETRGLPDEILSAYGDVSFFIPTTSDIRCLNLSTAVGIALYESLRPSPDNSGCRSENSSITVPG
ncbi:MAG: tRNA (cytidine(34)-2'-O)-methyltransferase [Desulfobacterales bacterium]